MRSPRQQLYDRFYYGFESALNRLGRDVKTRLRMCRVKTDGEFRAAYREVIRPYWAGYGVRPGRHWVKLSYTVTHTLDPRNIPRNLWFGRIIPHFNSPVYERQLQDKNLHHLMFPGVKRPETVYKCLGGDYAEDDLRPIDRETAVARCLGPGAYIVKPTTSTFEGKGIRVFRDADGQEDIRALLASYDGTDHIVQRFVSQHPALAAFNASTLNTIRIVTLVLHGEVHVLSSILRVGAPGNFVDNVSQGGYQCTIGPDGRLEKLAYTHRDGVSSYVETTASGARFEGFAIPAWGRLRDTACELALRLPYMKLIGWDLAVDDAGDVVFIEFNALPEQNEATCGPSFGEITDEVLEEVFGRK